ncbi:hypothetical protein JCM8547_009190 [Rhodosporidiobolus lusitaniae]
MVANHAPSFSTLLLPYFVLPVAYILFLLIGTVSHTLSTLRVRSATEVGGTKVLREQVEELWAWKEEQMKKEAEREKGLEKKRDNSLEERA